MKNLKRCFFVPYAKYSIGISICEERSALDLVFSVIKQAFTLENKGFNCNNSTKCPPVEEINITFFIASP